MGIINELNSPVMYLIVGVVVAFVALVCVVFMVRAYKAGIEIGIFISFILGIFYTLLLYKDFLPKLVKKFNIQIILVSHSPLMLTNIIQNSPYYNFISIDKKYTKEMKQNFSGVSF